MPELPEVETTRQGLLPHVVGARIAKVVLRERRLRWPIPASLARTLVGLRVENITRRGKYLLWECRDPHRAGGFLLCHLGMSGTLQVCPQPSVIGKHDHVDIQLESATTIRFNDPRRFGAMLWIAGSEARHSLLDSLGPEPLAADFDGDHLFHVARGRSVSVKEFIMNGHVVVGVGNIYASESLFRAGIHPARAAGRVSRARYVRLAQSIRETLLHALREGGSSLRDYVQTDGASGYFQLAAAVYDREGLPCRVCAAPVRALRQGQRSTYFCARCQR